LVVFYAWWVALSTTFIGALGKVNFLAAAAADMGLLEFVRKDLFFGTAIGALANK
jgi:hypothetical protein